MVIEEKDAWGNKAGVRAQKSRYYGEERLNCLHRWCRESAYIVDFSSVFEYNVQDAYTAHAIVR
jgi:hypothetical protein